MNVLRFYQNQSSTAKALQIAVPSSLVLGGGVYAYKKRCEYLADPVLQRAIMHLKRDQRVIDFCGENIQPGFLVTREQSNTENWIKYELTMSGASGKLKTVLIGDYLLHSDLLELDDERKTHEQAL